MPTAKEIEQAKGYHSLTFYVPPKTVISNNRTDWWEGDLLGTTPKNTWYDWHIVPTSRPVFAPPQVRNNFVEIPALDGYLDLTDLFGNSFGSREGSINFVVLNDYGIWYERFESILNYVHGKRLNVVMNDDPTKFYHGRWEVSEWTNNNDGTCSSITLAYHLQPNYGIVPEG